MAKRWVAVFVVSLGSLLAATAYLAWSLNPRIRELASPDPRELHRKRPADWFALDPPAGPKSLVFFGDSVLWTVNEKSDWDRRAGDLIDHLRADLLGAGGLLGPGWKVTFFCQGASNGYFFDAGAQGILRSGHLPTAVVIPINPVYLNGEMSIRKPLDVPVASNAKFAVPWAPPGPLTRWRGAFRYSAFALRAQIEALMTPRTTRENLDGAANDNDEELGRSPDAEALLIIKPYYGHGYSIDEKVMASMEHAGTSLTAAGVRVFYWVQPAPRGFIGYFAPPGTIPALDASMGSVVARLRSRGFEVLDLHASLAKGFIDPPTDHLGADGRIWLADKLSRWVAKTLGDNGTVAAK